MRESPFAFTLPQELLPSLLPKLADASQVVRGAVLQLLCSFDQPELAALPAAEGAGKHAELKVGK